MRRIISATLIVIISFLAFLPVLKNDFVNFDDNRYIYANDAITSLSWTNVKNIFTSSFIGHYQPLSILPSLFEYHFFKLDPFPYHLVNLMLHLFNCLLVFWLIFLLSGKVSVSFIAAILFGIHPMHVESIAWASERKDVLYSLFFLSALIGYIHYLKKDRAAKYYYISLFLFALSILAKSMAMTLPLLLLLVDHFYKRKPNKSMLMDKIPFFILAAIFFIVALLSQHTTGIIRVNNLFNPLDKIINPAYCIVFYLRKLFFPGKLACMYPPPAITAKLLSLSSLAFLIAAIAAFFRKRNLKKIIFGLAFFLITVFPVLQFMRMGESMVNDRYTYIPSIGIFYILGEGFFWLYTKKIRHIGLTRIFLTMALLGSFAILFSLTWNRTKVWKNSLSLWNDALISSPNSTIALNNRGVEFMLKNEFDNAYNDFTKSISIKPNNPDSYLNLAAFYIFKGEYENAIKFAFKTIEVNPLYKKAYPVLTGLLVKTGKYQEVIELCKTAVKVDPESAEIYSDLCNACGSTGDLESALPACLKAIKIKPDLAAAQANLAVTYFYLKQYELAAKHYKLAAELGYKINPSFQKTIEEHR